MVVNLDITSGTFYEHGPLIKLCMKFLNLRHAPEPGLTERIDQRQRNELAKFLLGVRVITQNPGEPRKIRPIKALSVKGAIDDIFRQEDGTHTTIAVSLLLYSAGASAHLAP